MIQWVLEHLKAGGDLCELYCGGGNFTLPLSTKFDKVLATEISKTSIKSAKESCELNGISNIEFIRMSSEEFVQALNNEREFNRLKDVNLDAYSFASPLTSHHSLLTTLFVDPPRAGLDETTRELAKRFDQIIYISCNAQTLQRDLSELIKTHTIKHFALFDQFAYTKHIECGVILEKQK
jgi:tRNA (uracil-5-)-methyltransferase